jgi:CheY-like chemotaxis protein
MSPKELRSRRIAIGLTIPQLAAELQISADELQQMENGQCAIPADLRLAARLKELERKKEDRSRDCLVVEDDASIRKLFAARLRAAGCTVDEAEDGLAALDATAERDYRLMLLDLRLPKLSGAEVLARVMKKPGPQARVVVISAAGSGDIREIANLRAVHAIFKKNFAITNADVLFPALAAIARV